MSKAYLMFLTLLGALSAHASKNELECIFREDIDQKTHLKRRVVINLNEPSATMVREVLLASVPPLGGKLTVTLQMNQAPDLKPIPPAYLSWLKIKRDDHAAESSGQGKALKLTQVRVDPKTLSSATYSGEVWCRKNLE